MPSTLAEISDTLEPGQNYASSYLAPGEVLAMTWQGGGGYGDPLRREPEKVATDLTSFRVSAEAATQIYGVVIKANGTVDAGATETQRGQLRRARIGSDVA